MIDSVTIVATSKTFQTGRVEWKLSGDDASQSEMLSGGKFFFFKLKISSSKGSPRNNHYHRKGIFISYHCS